MMYFHGEDDCGRTYLMVTNSDAISLAYQDMFGVKRIGFLEYRLRLIIMRLKMRVRRR